MLGALCVRSREAMRNPKPAGIKWSLVERKVNVLNRLGRFPNFQTIHAWLLHFTSTRKWLCSSISVTTRNISAYLVTLLSNSPALWPFVFPPEHCNSVNHRTPLHLCNRRLINPPARLLVFETSGTNEREIDGLWMPDSGNAQLLALSDWALISPNGRWLGWGEKAAPSHFEHLSFWALVILSTWCQGAFLSHYTRSLRDIWLTRMSLITRLTLAVANHCSCA